MPEHVADARRLQRVRESFARQSFMEHIGAGILLLAPGIVELELKRTDDLLQQHGFLHAGVLTSLMDSACGYASMSQMDEDSSVLSVEFKVNLLAPAAGNRFVARGQVLKTGKTLTVCRAEAFSADDGPRRLIAAMQATMMTIRDRPTVKD
jgi:uncharacterized protein (TIGR00369 family)